MNMLMTHKALMRAWMVCLIAGTTVMLQFVMQSSIGMMIPQLQSDFNVDILAISFLSSIYYLTYLLMQIPSGFLTDHFGARRTLIFSLLLFIISIFIFSLARNIFIAEIARVLMGLFIAPALTCSMWLATRWFTPHYFPVAAGVVETLGMIGGAVGYSLLSPIIHSTYGWRTATLVVALMCLALFVLLYFLVGDSPQQKSMSLQTKNRRFTIIFYGFLAMMKKPQAWLCGVYTGMMFTVVTGFASLWSVPFLEARFPEYAASAGNMTALLFFGVAIGTPICGWFGEWFGDRRRVMLIYALLALLFMSVIIYWPGLNFIAGNLLLFCLGFSCSSYVLPFVQMREIIPAKNHGVAMGYTNMMCILFGAPILQPLIGYLLQSSGHMQIVDGVQRYTLTDYQWAFLVFPCCFILAMMSLLGISNQSSCQS